MFHINCRSNDIKHNPANRRKTCGCLFWWNVKPLNSASNAFRCSGLWGAMLSCHQSGSESKLHIKDFQSVSIALVVCNRNDSPCKASHHPESHRKSLGLCRTPPLQIWPWAFAPVRSRLVLPAAPIAMSLGPKKVLHLGREDDRCPEKSRHYLDWKQGGPPLKRVPCVCMTCPKSCKTRWFATKTRTCLLWWFMHVAPEAPQDEMVLNPNEIRKRVRMQKGQ